MRRSLAFRLLAVVAALALALPMMAKPIKESIQLYKPAKIAGKSLEAGNYQLLIEDTKVTLRLKGETVAEVEGKWVESPSKARATTVVLQDDKIIEIRFGGKQRFLKFE
jgi:hypothetical protein